MLSLCVSCGILIGLVLLLFRFLSLATLPPRILADRQSKVTRKYGEAYVELSTDHGFLALNFFSWFLFRRLMIAIAMTFFADLTLLKLGICLGLTAMELGILLGFRPFKLRVDQAFNIWNAVALLVVYALFIPMMAVG